jgi:hypothetical protein
MSRFDQRSPIRNVSRLSPRSRTSLERSPTTPMHTTTAARLYVCAGLLSLTVAACGGSNSHRPDGGQVAGSSSTTSTVGPTTSATVADDQAAVLAAYHDFWATYDAYAAEPAPFDPGAFRDRFGFVTSDGEYDHLYQQFQLDRLRGWVSRGGEADVNRPKVVELTADRAVVDDCADDTGGVYDTKADKWVEPQTPGARSLFHVVLVRSDGRWKVTSLGGKDVACSA